MPPPSPSPPPATSSVPRSQSLPYQNDGLRCLSRHVVIDDRRRHQAADLSASHRTSFRDAPLDHREVRLDDLVGDGIVGILHKWVNYGKGWRPRWFVLRDGVLSYYKIHGPDCIDLRLESENGPKVIGEESARLLACRNNIGSHHPRKPIGEVHLKVSSIWESRTDDKRFCIFSGTKRLYLRAETGDDRVAWVETLQAVKDMFSRISNSELMAPVDNAVVSTEKLRERLQEEEVSEAAIQDCEQIMRSEFTALQKQLALLKQKQALLVDILRHLETEKADLENIDVDDSQRKSRNKGSAYGFRHEKYSEGSASESDYENEMHDATEEDIDGEDNAYSDTQDFLASGSFKSAESGFRISDYDSDDQNDSGVGSGSNSSMWYEGLKYPQVSRRKKLPNPIEKEKEVSLWSIIKDYVGKDLTKVYLPVYFNEPLSSLQKCFEDLEYSYLVDLASEWGKEVNI